MPPGSDDDAGAGAGGWRTLHPLTPLLRSGKVLLPATIGLAQLVRGPSGRQLVLPGIAVAAVLGLVYGYLSWRFTRFRLGDTDLELESGVLQRRRRRVPLDRVESVDLHHPLIARALGLAEVRVETVSSGDSEAALAYLPEDEAAELKAQLLARRAGLPADTPAPDAEVLAAVPVQPLLLTALALPVVLLAVVAVLASAAFLLSAEAALGVVLAGLPAVGAIALSAIFRLESLVGFTVSLAPDGLRIRRGLLNQRAQTVPFGRVQAVRIVEPLLLRPFSLVTVLVDVAGYRGGDRSDQAQTSLLLPIAPRVLVGPVLARVLPGLDLSAVLLAPPPRIARRRAPLSFGRLGVGVTERYVVTRRGRVRRTTDVVPHAKVQSRRITQGPFERRLGLATVHLDTPGSTVDAQARHRAAAEALDLAGFHPRRATQDHGADHGGDD